MIHSSTDRLRVAVVGAGRMARHHMRAIAALSDHAVLVAVADRSAQALAEVASTYPGALTATDLTEILARSEPDVVHVCTPMETHAELAREALKAGAHVYVEKPVTLSQDDLEPLLELASERERLLCAGHQVLFERPYRELLARLTAVGDPVHIESFFSFRPVRTGSGGGQPLTEAQQLIDVLPHPVYLLLDLLERFRPDGSTQVDALEMSNADTIHGLLSRGDLRGSLVVSLKARPVEHWLRVTGTNGTVHADFVRGSIHELLGPGSSGIDKAFNPYKAALQLGVRTTGALYRRIRSRGGSYPGLREAFGAFYQAIEEGTPSPTSADQVRGTVQLLEMARGHLEDRERKEAGMLPAPIEPVRVLVTGGTGLLGKEVVRLLTEKGVGVRVLARRLPPAAHRVPGSDYATADLAHGVDPRQLQGVETVIHCAAETAGDRAAHERNSIAATEKLMRASAAAGVRTFIHVSSVAVLDDAGPGPVRDDTALHPEPDKLGPYVWGKLESERIARSLGAELGVHTKVVRPVPLISRETFSPPGRLGRRIGNLYVAVGGPRDELVVADARDSARAIVAAAATPDRVPNTMNLVPGHPPTRRDLVAALRRASPEIRVIWLPTFLLHPLSWAAVGLQKILRPGRPAIRLSSAFAGRRYAPGPAEELMAAVRDAQPSSPSMEPIHAP